MNKKRLVLAAVLVYGLWWGAGHLMRQEMVKAYPRLREKLEASLRPFSSKISLPRMLYPRDISFKGFPFYWHFRLPLALALRPGKEGAQGFSPSPSSWLPQETNACLSLSWFSLIKPYPSFLKMDFVSRPFVPLWGQVTFRGKSLIKFKQGKINSSTQTFQVQGKETDLIYGKWKTAQRLSSQTPLRGKIELLESLIPEIRSRLFLKGGRKGGLEDIFPMRIEMEGGLGEVLQGWGNFLLGGRLQVPYMVNLSREGDDHCLEIKIEKAYLDQLDLYLQKGGLVPWALRKLFHSEQGQGRMNLKWGGGPLLLNHRPFFWNFFDFQRH